MSIRKLILFILLCLRPIAGFGAESGRDVESRIALVVGNKSYPPSLGGTLDNPINDANLVADALDADKFTTLTRKFDLDQKAMSAEIRAFAEKLRDAKGYTIGFFYYSGHGFGRPDNHQNYLVPIGVDRLDDAFDSSKTISVEDIISLVRNVAPSARLIFVFDACRNRLRLPLKELIPNFYDLSYGDNFPPNVFISFSTSGGGVASDEGVNGGPYATALATRLRIAGLELVPLFEYVRRDVVKVTNKMQRPWSLPDSIDEDIYLAGLPEDLRDQHPNSQASNLAVSANNLWRKELDETSGTEGIVLMKPDVRAARETWAGKYLVPMPGDPTGVIRGSSWGVVVSSFSVSDLEANQSLFPNRSVNELRRFCDKYPGLDFALIGSSNPSTGAGFNQIEIGYNLTKGASAGLVEWAKANIPAIKPWSRRYGWTGHSVNAIHCDDITHAK